MYEIWICDMTRFVGRPRSGLRQQRTQWQTRLVLSISTPRSRGKHIPQHWCATVRARPVCSCERRGVRATLGNSDHALMKFKHTSPEKAETKRERQHMSELIARHEDWLQLTVTAPPQHNKPSFADGGPMNQGGAFSRRQTT